MFRIGMHVLVHQTAVRERLARSTEVGQRMSVCARSSRPVRLPSLEAASETYSESLEEFEAREKVCF